MNKIMITAALAVMVAGLSSCSQNEDPKYHAPAEGSFTVNTPGLQNQYLLTNDDMTSSATFNLFCSQPDYGYAAICNYAAYVSLDPEVPTDSASLAAGKSILLENQNPTSAAMAFKTYALAIAANKMAGISEPEHYAGSAFDQGPVKLYFRAVCNVPNVEGSRVVSSNVVSYNNVKVVYAVLKPGWLYIVGDIMTMDGSVSLASGDTWVTPNSANEPVLRKAALMEPNDLAGEKIYVGHYKLIPKMQPGDSPTVDNASTFRFFTELKGWDELSTQLGSHKDNFYVLPLTDLVSDNKTYEGEMFNGQGNWGISTSEQMPITIVVDVPGMLIYIVEGDHEVTFTGRVPNFN